MEDLGLLLILILAAVGIHYIQKMISPRNDEKFKSIFNNLEDFNADEIHLSVISIDNPSLTANLMFIPAAGFDKSNKKIGFINSWKDDTVKIYSFNDIMESEIVVDGNTIVKTSTTSTVGRAVVGGVLTGGVGAVIGGVTGKKSHNEMVKNIDLKICVNDSLNPFYKIRFLDTECKKGDYLYKTTYQNAERCHGIITTFIKQSELKEVKNESVSSDVNNLLKLKELLDAGLLTNEEFAEQKNKILKQ
tara:strand:+ start:79 stop:819 length:741 start_codon:yes stop_codon:yes gene_type:complete